MTRVLRPLQRAQRRARNHLRAFGLQLLGRWRLRRGDPEGAAQCLERAVAFAPGVYTTLLHLCRAHLRRRDLARARGALTQAREAAPDRFAREAEAFTRAEGYDLAALTDVAGVRADVAPAVGPVRTTAVRARRPAPAAHPLGDCRDLDEYTRFRSMPAITRDEIDAIDWAALEDDLLE